MSQVSTKFAAQFEAYLHVVSTVVRHVPYMPPLILGG